MTTVMRTSTAVWWKLSAPANQVLDPVEIEALLAKNFQLEADDIELLNWSRLH